MAEGEARLPRDGRTHGVTQRHFGRVPCHPGLDHRCQLLGAARLVENPERDPQPSGTRGTRLMTVSRAR